MGQKMTKENNMGAYTRKATFVETKVKGVRVFTAVNKRAKTVVKRAGKRTKVTASELKALKGKGTYTFWKYVGDEQKLIRF